MDIRQVAGVWTTGVQEAVAAPVRRIVTARRFKGRGVTAPDFVNVETMDARGGVLQVEPHDHAAGSLLEAGFADTSALHVDKYRSRRRASPGMTG